MLLQQNGVGAIVFRAMVPSHCPCCYECVCRFYHWPYAMLKKMFEKFMLLTKFWTRRNATWI